MFEKIKASSLMGALAIMLAALFWSIDGLFIRPQFYNLPADLVVFLEHTLGFLVLCPFIYFSWDKIRFLSKKSWGAIIWVCFFGGMLGTIMITKAFFAAMGGETTFATVVILQKLQPFFALLLAGLILKERLSKEFYLWTAVAIIASYFIAFGKSGLQLSEINWFHNAAFFAFLAAFSFGSSTVFGKRITNHLDYKAVAALRFGITALMVLVLVLFNNTFSQFKTITSLQWELFALIVLTSGAGAMFIYYFGLRKVSASAATILELFWPFSAIILDYVFNKNILTSVQIIAVFALLAAFTRVSMLDKLNVKFSAQIIRGKGRGEELGFKTANLDNVDLDIPYGVYTVLIKVKEKEYNGLMHFGLKETFNEPPSMEVLIKDFSEDIYGQKAEVKIIRKLREVKKFKSKDLLVEEVRKNLAQI